MSYSHHNISIWTGECSVYQLHILRDVVVDAIQRIAGHIPYVSQNRSTDLDAMCRMLREFTETLTNLDDAIERLQVSVQDSATEVSDVPSDV